MARDPYIACWIRQRRNQVRVRGLAGALGEIGLPLLASAILIPFVRRLFLGFLDGPVAGWTYGTEQVVLRAVLVVVGWLSLDVYAALLRGDDRPVLGLLPVDPLRVVRAQLVEVAARRWWLVVGGALVLAPIATAGRPLLWIGAVVALAGAFVVGLTGSAVVHLLAVAVAEDPRWSALLDLTRGDNPRAQAAFIYAPGVVLLGAAGLAMGSAQGTVIAASGDPVGWLLLALPFGVAALATLPLPALARGQWFRGSAVLADIDARHAALADPEEARRVYLDWVVRFLPASIALHALDDLRHGWRTRRTLIAAAWFAGLGAFAAGWTDAAEGPDRTALVVILASFGIVTNGVLLDQDQPAFLRHWLPRPWRASATARAVVLLLWLAPLGPLGAIAVAIRRDLTDAGFVLASAAAAAGVAIPLAIACGGLPERRLVVYGPVAAVAAVALATWVGSP